MSCSDGFLIVFLGVLLNHYIQKHAINIKNHQCDEKNNKEIRRSITKSKHIRAKHVAWNAEPIKLNSKVDPAATARRRTDWRTADAGGEGDSEWRTVAQSDK